MPAEGQQHELRHVSIDLIDRNPENPRILFRPTELAELQESIRRHGVQVPISVYKTGRRFVLIDGERRWRCAVKLNLRTIPAIIQGEPSQLDNLLLMFNIHALREQWDLLTIALKLPRISNLLGETLGHNPNERELAQHTGLSRAIIRRSRLLMELPQQHKETILSELQRPKEAQRLTEDFFIEMERSLRTVARSFPDVVRDKDAVREVLIHKYQTGIITNITDFRSISKIARAENVEADRVVARKELTKVFAPNDYGIAAAYQASVSSAYAERGLLTKIVAVRALLEEAERDEEVLDENVKHELRKLQERIARILEREP
jgi:ParB family transcriptional regulator, chromosome partitioning protein